MNEFLVNIIGTIIGGLILTLILFLLNEYAFSKVNLTGEWNSIIKIERTTHSPFKNLAIEYKIHLIQKGYELSGSGEKIKDVYPDGSQTTFNRKNRVLITIEGYFERKYFGRSIVYLHINEVGRIRETRATFKLFVYENNKLEGKFISTAADAQGDVKMKKE